MSLELDKRRERLQPIVAPDPKLNRNGTPKTDGCGCCLTCGAWTPYGHPDAHDHRQGCSAEIAQHEYQRALQAFIKAAPADITTLLSQVDRFAPDASSWRIAVEKALGVQPDPVNHDQDWAHRAVLGLRELGNGVAPEAVDRLLAGLPAAKGGDSAANPTWIPDGCGGFVLVADVFGGITVATIATKAQLIPDSAPLRWTADGRPPQAGDAWSFTEALKAIRRALPSCPVPDLPAGVK